MKIEFEFDGFCRIHTSYDPAVDGQRRGDCDGCETLYVIWLYTKIAKRKAEKGEGIMSSLISSALLFPEATHG